MAAGSSANNTVKYGALVCSFELNKRSSASLLFLVCPSLPESEKPEFFLKVGHRNKNLLLNHKNLEVRKLSPLRASYHSRYFCPVAKREECYTQANESLRRQALLGFTFLLLALYCPVACLCGCPCFIKPKSGNSFPWSLVLCLFVC